jgi:hypothetical protein
MRNGAGTAGTARDGVVPSGGPRGGSRAARARTCTSLVLCRMWRRRIWWPSSPIEAQFSAASITWAATACTSHGPQTAGCLSPRHQPGGLLVVAITAYWQQGVVDARTCPVVTW